MNLEQTTDRLILRILSADDAEKVLQFYKDNAAIFEQFEPLIGNDFYSLEHQKNLLTYEYQEILKLHMLRFWIFEKDNPDRIIGTVSFHNISPNIYSSAQLATRWISISGEKATATKRSRQASVLFRETSASAATKHLYCRTTPPLSAF